MSSCDMIMVPEDMDMRPCTCIIKYKEGYT